MQSMAEEVPMKSITYDRDLLLWIEEQTDLYRAGRLAELDLGHIFDELEAAGNEQRIALQTALRNILIRLLKLALSPPSDLSSRWIDEITNFRDQAQAKFEQSPSLQRHAAELFSKAWIQARRSTEKSFSASCQHVTMPAENPFSLAQALDADYIPLRSKANLDSSLADNPHLPPAICGWLTHQGITTYRQLIEMTADNLLDLPYSGGRHGHRKVAQIQQALLTVGLSLKPSEQ